MRLFSCWPLWAKRSQHSFRSINLAALPVKKLDESLLTSIPPFRRLDRGQSMMRSYARGESIFMRGDPAEFIGIVLEG